MIKERLINCLREKDFDIVILTSLPNVIYASEFEVPYFGGFMADMAKTLPMVTAVIDVAMKEFCLVASDFYKSKIQRAGFEERTIFFPCFNYMTDNDPVENFQRALSETLYGHKSCKKVGIEIPTAPCCLMETIKRSLPGTKICDVSMTMEESRKIKTSKEIACLECAARGADAAQDRLVELSREPGVMTELDVWFEVQKAVSKVTSEMNPFYGELVTGPRTGLSDYPLGPTNRKIEKGDIAIMDVGPRVSGYWSDCSNVAVFWQEPNKEQLRYFRAVKAAYEAGRDAIRPGKTFLEVNEAMSAAYVQHGFSLCSYLGHQIGVQVNEKPRFTLFDYTVLEENMVVCIEPQLYSGKSGVTGVRLEKMLHVTKNGARELNHFSWGIEE